MKQHVIWGVLLLVVYAYTMSNKPSARSVYFPRGPALSVDGLALGAPLEVEDPGGALGWGHPSGETRRVATRDGKVWALEGKTLEQGPRTLLPAGASRQDVERCLGRQVELPYWAPKTSTFYLYERVEVEYDAQNRVKRLRVYTEEALDALRKAG